MNNTTPIRFASPRRERNESGAAMIQLAAAILAGGAFFVMVVIALTLGYRIMYFGRIFPGVTVAGVNVSGMSRKDAALKIQTALTFPYSGRIVLRDGQNVWVE